MEIHRKNILRTLLYYDIFRHPLNREEIYSFFPENSITREEINSSLAELTAGGQSEIGELEGYYYLKPNAAYVQARLEKEKYSASMWKTAYRVTHIIKRFPFVRSVIATGSLSKNSSDSKSDLDFMVITAPRRLWVARTLLMLFKKTVLLNSKKYFCVNYFIASDNMVIEERNIYTATEIVTLKATYNTGLLEEFLQKNLWVTDFFPNYTPSDASLHKAGCKVNNNHSIGQKMLELFFPGRPGDKLDDYLRQMTKRHWKKKYAHLAEAERNFRLKSTKTESKAHPHSVQKTILAMYEEKLKKYDL
jgi:predicted nucleotidyltransferase